MASGLPVIATAVGGIRQLVQDGTTGLQVQSEDPKGLAQAMARVLDDRGLAERLGRGAREWAVGHVAPERVVGEYLELYRQVLRG
jgi:starch synthase